MLVTFRFILPIFAAGCGILDAAQPWTVDAILNVPAVSDPQIRADGHSYAYVRRNLEGAVWRNSICLDSIPAASARVISVGARPRWSPDARRLAYLDGQVSVFDLETGASSVVTHSPSPVTTYSWTPDGRGIAYLAADPGPAPDPVVADTGYRYARLYLQPLAGGEPKRLTLADRQVVSFALSSDGTHAVYAAQPTPRNRDTFDQDLYELDLRTLAEKPLVTQPGSDSDPSYSPDGKWIAFHSQGGTLNYFAARHVALVASGGGKVRYLTEHPSVPLDVFRGGNSFSWSRDSAALYYLGGHSVRDYLVRQNLASGKMDRIADRIASPPSFTPDLSRAVFLKPYPNGPSEITLLEGSAESRLTNLADSIAAYPRIEPKVVNWKSRDGLPIEGVLWLPFTYQPGHRVPLLVELHGGPTGVILDSFPVPRTYPTQAFLEHGFAVFAPNFRGSVNYGADFRMKIVESQGFGDFDDVMTGVDHLIEEGIADPARLGVMGWSYGGFLTAWIIGHTDRFKAASVGAPATDWTTYYGQSDGPRSTLMTYFGGTPWQNPESYARHSPRTGIANIHTPSMLQIGALDLDYTSELYWSLTDRKIPVESVVYPREPHGFVEPAHQRDVMERNLRWFSRWLAPAN